jgi:hypothetical protein
MKSVVAGQLGMKAGCQQIALLRGNDPPIRQRRECRHRFAGRF